MINKDSLYLKHRPSVLEEIVGNRSTVDSLQSVIDSGKIPHAILLIGPSGTGKTTIARIIKDALNCAEQDYREIDSAQDRSIDGIREIRRQMQMKPIAGKVRVWLLDEAHQIGVGGGSSKNAAQNALLKALEDTPQHVYFILATTELNGLLPAIKTRCMTFTMNSLADSQIRILIQDVVDKEKADVTEEALDLISRQSLGSPRLALNVLQKIITLNPKQQARAVEQAAAEENQVIDLCRALIKREKWTVIVKILKGLQEQEPESIRRAILGYSNNVLLNGGDAQAYLLMDTFRYPTYDSGWPGITMACYEIVALKK